MIQKETPQEASRKDRQILVAVDRSENAKRAVGYVADFLGGKAGFHVTILTIIPEPSADYFESEEARNEWINKEREESLLMMEKYREVLVQSGFSKKNVEVMLDVRQCPSLAECILEEQKKLGCCTVVVGRRGISRKEEFIFGSTSSKILHSAKNCAVWVIE